MFETKPFGSRLNDGSRMSGDVQVWFCERCALESAWCTAT